MVPKPDPAPRSQPRTAYSAPGATLPTSIPTLCEILALDPPPDHKIPTLSGQQARRDLVARWGLPNVAPRAGERVFGRCRLLFVDDVHDGQPQAYWVPDAPVKENVGEL